MQDVSKVLPPVQRVATDDHLAHIASILLAARSMLALAGQVACAGSDVACAIPMQSALKTACFGRTG